MNPSGETILAEEVARRASTELRRHALFLGLAVFIAAMAFELKVRRDERSTFAACPIGRCLIRAIRAPCLASPARAAV